MSKLYSVKLSIVALSVYVLFMAGVAHAQSYDFVQVIGGGYGTGDGQFNSASGMTMDASHNLYVADRLNHRVQVFDAQGNYVRQFGTHGTAAGQLNYPINLAFAPNGDLLVVDMDNINVFTPEGVFVKRYSVQFVIDIAVDRSTGDIYALGSSKITVLDAGLTRELRSFGSYGTGNLQFDNARAIELGPDDNLYVADGLNDRVQIISKDGTFVDTFGSSGTADGEFNNATAIALDGSGNVYVGDGNNDRVQIFTKSANGYTMVRKFGSFGTNNAQFKGLSTILLDDQGKLYFSDFNRNDVQVFTKQTNSVLTFTDVTKTYGEADFKLTATSEVEGHPVMYKKLPANSGDITLVQQEDGYYAHIARAGTVVLRAYIPDDITTGPAHKDIVITINKAEQRISFASLEPAILNVTSEVTLTATASSELPISFTSSNPNVASIVDNVLTVHAVGTITITASQEGNLNYLPAAEERSFTVTTITDAQADEPGAVQVYPIPARDYITIRPTGNQQQARISIMDASGRVVRNVTPTMTEEQTLLVYIGDLNPGLYYLRMNNGKKQAYRIVKN